MEFNIITIFPDIFKAYFKQSIIKKAEEKGIIKINIIDLRKFAGDTNFSVDDKPFGGGRGMVLKIEPIYRAVEKAKEQSGKKGKTKVVLFTPRGKRFNQKIASNWTKMNNLILICGRYEGVDERAAKYIADDRISIGNYVLMGGEIPALIVVEAVSRLLPGVLGKSSKLREERIGQNGGFIEYPQYTRPAVFVDNSGKKWKVPKVLLSGNHKEIEEWRKKHSRTIE